MKKLLHARTKHYSMKVYEKKTCDQEIDGLQSRIELEWYIDAFIINIKIDIYM
jgi:hypothetical protein